MLNNSFAMLMCDEETDKNKLKDIVEKISLRKHIRYNRVIIHGEYETAFILYNPNKEYAFEMARNKKLKIIWKDNDFFGCISFKDNTKGIVLYHLEESSNKEENIIEGEIIKPNIKQKYKGRKMLISSIVLDENEPYLYEEFCFIKRLNQINI